MQGSGITLVPRSSRYITGRTLLGLGLMQKVVARCTVLFPCFAALDVSLLPFTKHNSSNDHLNSGDVTK